MKRPLANTVVLLCSAWLMSTAQGQPSSPGQATASAPTQPSGQRTVRSMFNFADANKDGRLTRDEAKGHLPLTFSDFASIDIDSRGWISFEQFVAYTNQRVGKQADDILHSNDRL
ncbi:MAG: EF-hand domain-containing protein [Rhizobacter sp.]